LSGDPELLPKPQRPYPGHHNSVVPMGEAKRRAIQGLPPRQPKAKPTGASDTAGRILPWLPINRQQADRFVQLSTRGAWVGIAALVLFWLTVRFIGPALGWWELADS
jgi:hypothetical protein